CMMMPPPLNSTLFPYTTLFRSCSAALSFVENLPVDAALRAEQSLIGAITSCTKQTLDPVSRKLDAALEKRVVAPRALMATMAAQDRKSTRLNSSHQIISYAVFC